MEYIRFSEDYNKNSLIPVTDNPYNHIKNKQSAYFVSMMKYSEDQYQVFKKAHSLAGMSGGHTNKLWADFDSEANLSLAFKDCKVFIDRLFKLGFKEENIQIAFSGSKGVGVIVDTKQSYTIEQVKTICSNLSADLDTFDVKMYDHQRIFRLMFSRNEKTGLYKIPLTLEELTEANVPEIKKLATTLDNYDKEEVLKFYEVANVELPKELTTPKNEPLRLVPLENLEDLSLEGKPKFLTNCRWSLQKGFFKEGERSSALLCLAATYKNLGFDKEHTYRLLKGVAELQSARESSSRFPDNEIWNNIITQVYGPNWKNGQYSCKETGSWLGGYCNKLGIHKCSLKDNNDFLAIDKVFDTFKNYAENIEQNTIKTGILSLDKAIRFRVGQMIGLLGSPSSGKTSLALNILENTSRAGIPSVFYSLDMADSEMFQKLVQKVTGYDEDKIYKIFQSKSSEIDIILKKVSESFKNVKFSFNTGISVDGIQEAIKAHEADKGEKVKLVLIDYNELLAGPHSDATANSGHIAGELKKFTNSNGLCTVVLLQPAKVWGDASDELTSYRATKGSSLLEQCFSTILGIYRPGFTPKNSDDDKFMILNALKNRMGKLFSLSFNWSGLRGEISEMDDQQYYDLQALLKRKAEEKEKSDEGWK